MSARNKVTILSSFQAAPPPASVPELTIPLTSSDMSWIGFFPVQRLLFYHHPGSTSFFIDTIVPRLKNSLASALNHFPSLAGNLILFPDSTKPEIRYLDRDSVSVVFAESTSLDFEYLVSDQPRNCSDFYALVPGLPESSESGDLKMTPLVAFQVTLFPGKGMCIGFSYQHVAGDGTSMLSFFKAWSQICKLGEDEAEKPDFLPPIYDREVMRFHTKGIDDGFWNDLRSFKPKVDDDMVAEHVAVSPEVSDKVRSTFVLSLEEIQRLKKHVSARKTSVKHLSTFTVVCGYVWNCMVKSGNGGIDKVKEDDEHYFIFGADCRGRTDPPVPENYFGNCLVPIQVIAKTMELCKDEGVVNAAELIGDALQRRLNNDEGVFQGLRTFLKDMAKIKDFGKTMSVAGSPRQNYYNVDFGWGKPRKVEIPSIDLNGAISLGGCRDESGGLEIGLALPKRKMGVFSDLFREGLHSFQEEQLGA